MIVESVLHVWGFILASIQSLEICVVLREQELWFNLGVYIAEISRAINRWGTGDAVEVGPAESGVLHGNAADVSFGNGSC